jgi:hypothetical protein
MCRIAAAAFIVAMLPGLQVRAEEGMPQKLDGKGATIAIVGMEKCCGAEAWPEAEKMTETEFLSLHYRVVTVYGKANGDVEKMGELIEIADGEKAVCTVRITRVPGEKSAEVDAWVWDQATGKTAFRHLVMENLNDSDGPSVVALRVVELLRAALMEPDQPEEGLDEGESPAGPPSLDVGEIGAEEEGAARPAVSLKASPRKHGFIGLRVGFMGIGSPGGTGGQGAVELAVRWNPLAMLALELGGFVSVVGRDIRHLDASASFDVAAVRVWALWEFMNRARVRFGAGVGGGVLLAWTKGTAPETYWVRTETGHAACFAGGLQMAVVLTRHLWLRTGFSVGLTLPDEITVVFAGEKVASFGRPLMEGFLGLEGRIP